MCFSNPAEDWPACKTPIREAASATTSAATATSESMLAWPDWKVSERWGMPICLGCFTTLPTLRRFDVNPLNSLQNLTTSGSFGVYGATLHHPQCNSGAALLVLGGMSSLDDFLIWYLTTSRIRRDGGMRSQSPDYKASRA